jgi:hypothetical protein
MNCRSINDDLCCNMPRGYYLGDHAIQCCIIAKLLAIGVNIYVLNFGLIEVFITDKKIMSEACITLEADLQGIASSFTNGAPRDIVRFVTCNAGLFTSLRCVLKILAIPIPIEPRSEIH